MKRQKYIIFQIKLGKAAIGNMYCYQTLILQDIFPTLELLAELADTAAFRGFTADLT